MDPWYGWNPLERNRALQDDPYPILNRVRDAHPVHQTPQGYWRILRHADITRVFKQLKTGVRTTAGVLPGVDEVNLPPMRFMVQQDAPDHLRLRKLVSKVFTPVALERMRAEITDLVEAQLDAVERKGELDVIADLALPVPSAAICLMMGVPLADRPKFADWTSQLTHLLVPTFDAATRQRALGAAAHLLQYMNALIEERRHALTDDLLSIMIRAEEDGDRLSHAELLIQAVGLLAAGFETTIGLIGNGVRALLAHPAELAKLRARPELIDSAVEECLRFDGPITGARRVLHQDAEIGGHQLPTDTQLLLSFAAAHRDPEVFADPDRFDIERPRPDHFGFGAGAHFCLGAHLARMETKLAIGGLVRRFSELTLASDERVWGESVFRVLKTLPVHFSR